MIKKIIILLLLVTLSLYAKIPETKQLIVVSTENWATPEGELQRLKRDKASG